MNIKHANERLSSTMSNPRFSKKLDKVVYIRGDFGEPIYPDFKFASTSNDTKVAREELKERESFDVVSCQFALHYFFENEETVMI